MKERIYASLETKMLSYPDYADIPVAETNEPLVPIIPSEGLIAYQIDRSMLPVTGEQIFVRSSVLAGLQRAAERLTDRKPAAQLEVVYGYRSLAVQRQNFARQKERLAGEYQGDALLAAAHRYVAVPEVAGHPAGAAVDIHIKEDGEPLEFGTKHREFVPDTMTFSPYISTEAWRNRQLLREVMLQAGFAPFDGEWWHFSYGDKEWARYYNRPAALYDQLEFKAT